MTPLADDFASIALELKRIEAEKAVSEKQEEYNWTNFVAGNYVTNFVAGNYVAPDYDGA